MEWIRTNFLLVKFNWGLVVPLDLENILQRTTQTIQQHFHSLLASAYTYSKELINNQPSNQDHTHLEQLSANAYQSIMYLQRLQVYFLLNM